MEFIKNFFRDNTSESSARLVLIMSAVNVNLMCLMTMLFYFETGKDFSSQCALLSGILLGFAGTFKAIQKGKENPNNLKENL